MGKSGTARIESHAYAHMRCEMYGCVESDTYWIGNPHGPIARKLRICGDDIRAMLEHLPAEFAESALTGALPGGIDGTVATVVVDPENPETLHINLRAAGAESHGGIWLTVQGAVVSVAPHENEMPTSETESADDPGQWPWTRIVATAKAAGIATTFRKKNDVIADLRGLTADALADAISGAEK